MKKGLSMLPSTLVDMQTHSPQELNLGLPHWRWIPYQLSHKGSLRILEWVAYPFSSGSSQTRNWTALQADSLPTELSGKPNRKIV